MKRKTATARDQRSPANIEKGGKKFRRQPSAERELHKWNRNSVPTGWNGKSGIAQRVVRLFRKISVLFAFKPVEPDILPTWKAPWSVLHIILSLIQYLSIQDIRNLKWP